MKLWSRLAHSPLLRGSLRTRIQLVALPVSALLAVVVGSSVSSFAGRLFLRGYLASKLSLARALAHAIDGDEHRRFDSYAAIRDPVYRGYLRYLSGVMSEERGITYLYTLGYDPGRDRLTYAIDARIAPRDELRIETDEIAFMVSFDDAGRALIDANQTTRVDEATADVRGKAVPLRVTAAPSERELLVSGASIAAFVALDPLEVRTPAGLLNREQRALRCEVLFDGKPTLVHYSFSSRGDSQSDPGSELVDSEENLARYKAIIRAGKDFVEPELARDNRGYSLTAYGIIRDGGGAPVGAVFLDVYAVEFDRFRRSLGRVVYPVSLLAFALAFGMLVALAQLLVVPLKRVTAAVGAVAGGNLEVRLPDARADELGALARGFNGMVEALVRDQAERRLSEERLAAMAYRDELTGLFNRKSFHDHFADTLNQAKRSEHEKLRGLLFLDLDHFKDVNDAMGHDFGDRLLHQVARRIRSHVRESDFVFRQGGDEFTVILNMLARETDAAIVAQKLIDALEEPFEIQGSRVHIGTSIGIALYPRDGETAEQLVSNADTALFEAKKERHVFRFFTREMQEQALRKIGLMSRLLHALEGGRLALQYQPQLDAAGRVVGIEALLRWNDGANGLVEPDVFIPLAEETGAILPVGKWVLGSACLLARELRANGFDKVPVFVNVTAREFHSTDILSVVEEAFRATGIPATALGLEISEQALSAERKIADRLKVLSGWGMPLVIDHFGRGTSSLVRLENLPAKAVKIDRRLVGAVERGRSDVEIIKAVAAFSYASGRQVAAVGAEREQQVRLLRSVGCEVLQGFYFCRPLDAPELLAYLKKQGVPR